MMIFGRVGWGQEDQMWVEWWGWWGQEGQMVGDSGAGGGWQGAR